MKQYIRVFLVAGIALLVFLFFFSGMHHHLSLENIKTQQAFLQNLYAGQPVLMMSAFAAVYIPIVVLNLPGALVLGLSAGAIFGPFSGTILISFASSIGASLACLLSRYLLRDWVHRRFKDKLTRVNAGIREEGAFYLFALRLMPVIPFFIINMVMGLTSIRLRTFYWVSQLGMLPGTAIFVNAGSQIGKLDSLSGILSPGLIVSLALIGIFPLIVRRILTYLRKRYRQNSIPVTADIHHPSDSSLKFASLLNQLRESCTDCGACQKSCRFLGQYGTPKQMAARFDFLSPRDQALAYECSLCGLCTAICPEKLDPSILFLEIRRLCVNDQNFNETAYRVILGYEKRGASPLFSWYGLPEGCDTVFFPGCTLPGTRPAVTMSLYRQLKEFIPALGVVLDCCAKPSHDLGRTAYFTGLFKEMKDYLTGQGIRHILTACPNCTKIFRQYGQGITVRTVYEVLQENMPSPVFPESGKIFAVHDPCAVRGDFLTHQAVRSLISGMGHTVMELKHRGERTLCCGEGGMVAAVNPGFASAWAALRSKETNGYPMITYCAGCTGFLNRVSPTFHIADLIYRQESVMTGKLRVDRAPLTYWNRLRLKHRLKKEIQPKIQRTRPSNTIADLENK